MAEIWARASKKTQKTFHARLEHEKKGMRLPGGDCSGAIPQMHYSKVNIEEIFLDTSVLASFVGLSKVAANSLSMMLETMYPVCPLHNDKCRKLVWKQVVKHGEAVSTFVYFVHLDWPNQYPQYWTDQKSNHNISKSVYFKGLLKIRREILRSEPHVHIFWCKLKSGTNYCELTKEDYVKEETDLFSSSSDQKEMKETAVFHVEPNPLPYMHAVDTYRRSPAYLSLYHTNVSEMAIDFWHMGYGRKETLTKLNYPSHGEAHTTFLTRTTEMNHMSKVPAEETFVVMYDAAPGCDRAFLSVQEGIV